MDWRIGGFEDGDLYFISKYSNPYFNLNIISILIDHINSNLLSPY